MSVTSDTTDSSSSSSPVPSSHKITADDIKIGRAAADASLELHRTRFNNLRFQLEEMKKFEELQYKDWPYFSSLKSIYDSRQLFPVAAAAAAGKIPKSHLTFSHVENRKKKTIRKKTRQRKPPSLSLSLSSSCVRDAYCDHKS